jgi:flagellar hook-associated protein 2
MSDSTFRAGGLASGMDTNSIIDQLVSLESQPLTQLKTRQTGIQTQISALGDIVSRLSSLASAAQGLGDDGVLAAKATSSSSTFSAAPGTSAIAGRYSVQVLKLAQAGKWRSQGIDPAVGHAAGTLTLTVQGKTYDPPITITQGESPGDVAAAIRATGAPVSAVVLSDGTKSYLSVTNRDTGVPATGKALELVFAPKVAGSPGDPPMYSEITPARNASFVIDDLTFSRPSNTVSDAIPGTTLTLTAEGSAEDLVLENDVSATQGRLQTFVDAYNGVMKLLQRQLAPTQSTDRSSSLTGDSAVRSLQTRLQSILVAKVPGLGDVRTLADLGVKTAKDGSLSIDSTVLTRALSRDPAAVNALFSTASSGIAASVRALVDQNTRVGDGLLTLRISGLQDTVSDLTDQQDALSRRIDAYRANLVAQFTAMESTVSSLKSIGNFLTARSNQSSS